MRRIAFFAALVAVATTPSSAEQLQRLVGAEHQDGGRSQPQGLLATPDPRRLVYPEYLGLGGNIGAGGLVIGGGRADEDYQGTILRNDGHPNWASAVTSLDYNPTEWIIGGAGAQGRASTTGTSNVVTRVDGTNFDPIWVGDRFYLNRVPYRVASVAANGNSLTLTGLDGSPVKLPAMGNVFFQYVMTTGAGRASIVKGVVTWISGQQFLPFVGQQTEFRIVIDGKTYTSVSFQSPTQITLSDVSVNKTNVAYRYSANISDQVASLRIGKQNGAIEETLTISGRATGEWEIAAGSVQEATNPDPLRIKNGVRNGSKLTQIDVQGGGVSLGGSMGAEGMRVLNVSDTVNLIEVSGTGRGLAPTITARGADTNVGLGLDVQGAGGLVLTGRLYKQVLLEVAGAAKDGLAWPLLAPGATPTIQPGGSHAASIALVGNGDAGAQTGLYVRAADPSPDDIPPNRCVDWNNTAANTLKRVCNLRGTLHSLRYD